MKLPSLSIHIWVPFSFPCVTESLSVVSYGDIFPTSNTPLRSLVDCEKALFCSLLILLMDCIMKSQDCVVITQRSSTTIPAKINSGQNGGRGERPRREEVEEGSCRKQTRCLIYALSFVFRFCFVTQLQVPDFEENKKNPHHRVLVSFSSFPLQCCRVWAQGELLMCKGINWAKMRYNHKCKVASAATTLYSLVAYKPPLCLQEVTLYLLGVLPRRFPSVSVRILFRNKIIQKCISESGISHVL